MIKKILVFAMKAAENLLTESLLAVLTAGFLFLRITADAVGNYRRWRGYWDRFEKKHDHADLFLMALQIPESDASIA